jgi:GNAT superfamily N-acetyltransferase
MMRTLATPLTAPSTLPDNRGGSTGPLVVFTRQDGGRGDRGGAARGPGGCGQDLGGPPTWREASTRRWGGSNGFAKKLAASEAVVVVGRLHGAVAAMALAEPWRTAGGLGSSVPGRCHLSMVFVDPARLGRGLGSVLMGLIRVLEGPPGWRWTSLDPSGEHSSATSVPELRLPANGAVREPDLHRTDTRVRARPGSGAAQGRVTVGMGAAAGSRFVNSEPAGCGSPQRRSSQPG